ncbi:hypothetical protein H4R19_007037, partial [Coemansia spiralis]
DNEGRGSGPDPAYPGCFKGEDCDDSDHGRRRRVHDSGTCGAPRSSAALLWATAVVAALAL